MARVNKTLTVGADPINIVTGMTAAAMATAGMTSAYAPAGATFFIEPLRIRALFIQMKAGGAGIGYVLDGITPGLNPSTTASTDVTATMGPASANAPGDSYSDSDTLGRIYADRCWVAGDNAGDEILVSYDIMD